MEYAKSGDLEKARALSNPEVSPHLSFADIGGRGYADRSGDLGRFTTEFVCIPRPLDRYPADGGPINYRVSHHAKLWRKGEKPVLTQRVLEGNADLCI
ncbi:MAG TPA: hypothetical protein VGM62_01040 [Chthoniobacterales bacterium]|jgi:alkaline phosphatase D